MAKAYIWKKSKKLKAKARLLKRRYGRLLREVKLKETRFVYLEEGGKLNWLGKVTRVQELFNLYTIPRNLRFIVVLNKDKINAEFPKNHRKIITLIVLLHELLHIGPKGKLRRHDIEDFRVVLEKFGVNWTLPRSASVMKALSQSG